VGIVALAVLVTQAATAPDISLTARARSVRPGELVVLTIRTRPAVETIAVQAFGKDLHPYPVDAATWRVLVGIDVSTTPGSYSVRVTANRGEAEAVHRLRVVPRAFRTRTLKVDPAFVTPPPEVAERIARESRMLTDLWATSTSDRLWTGSFVRPVPHEANSAFGSRSIFNGQPRSQHSGADFRSPAGTPIRAPNRGRVAVADDLYFSGNTVVLDHGQGLYSVFAHLSKITVENGDVVERGASVGAVGATGRVTGPHLHWAVRVNGARVDPLSLLAVLGPAPKR
jgi:murein DD-endopeptidase MepM/ murein hydrolase activator NlpD